MKNIFLFITILIFAQGCSSIDQPTASRALVEQQFVTPTVSVDLSLSAALSNSKDGTTLSVQKRALVMGSKFFAASGLTCRKVSSKQTGQEIYCLNGEGSWFKVNNVISEYNENDLREAGL